MSVHIVDHPLVATRLSLIRAKTSGTEVFRRNLQELSLLLLMEASRAWPVANVSIETPLQSCAGVAMAGPVVLVPILRAGLGMRKHCAR